MSRLPGAVAAMVACALAATGCTNPDALPAKSTSSPAVSPGGAGEPNAPSPTPPANQLPVHLRSSASKALTAFADLYVNWSYRNLTGRQRLLAAMSVGSARQAEQQAAASSAQDPVIRSGQIRNSGRILAVAPDTIRRGYWVITTLEQTSGNTQYRGLPAGYHVTLARLVNINGGYAVSEWLPQS